MNKFLNLCTMALLAIVTLLASCSDDDNSTPTPQPGTAKVGDGTYTIMFYGCSDSDLDEALRLNLQQVISNGKKDRVNFRALVKFSPELQAQTPAGMLDGTRLITYADTANTDQFGIKVHENSYRLDNPQNLADFINETKQLMPADNYILVLWDHGDQFGFGDDPVEDSYDETTKMRGMLIDDHTDNTLSTYELEEALRLSGTKMKLIYFDVCLMGMVETYTQIKDYADYGMGAVNPTPDLGGNYVKFINSLQENDTFENAMKQYVPGTVSVWKTNNNSSIDLSCFDLSYIDQLNAVIKNATDEITSEIDKMKERGIFDKQPYTLLCNDESDPNDQTAYNALTLLRLTHFYDSNKETTEYSTIGAVMPIMVYGTAQVSTDLSTTFGRLIKYFDNMSLYSDQIDNILKKMTVASSFYGMPWYVEKMTMGITWPTIEYTQNLGWLKWPEYDENLKRSAFNKATGWMNFVEGPVSNIRMLNINSLFEEETYYIYFVDALVNERGSYHWNITLEPNADCSEEEKTKVAELQDDINNKMQQTTCYAFHASQGLLKDIERYIKSKDTLLSGVDNVKITVTLTDEAYTIFDDDLPTSFSSNVSLLQ